MVSLVYLPVTTFFHIPGWVSVSVTVAGLGVSALLSGWLPKHPRIQKYVTALALATVFALAMASAQAPAKPKLLARPFALIECVCWWGWESWCCYF